MNNMSELAGFLPDIGDIEVPADEERTDNLADIPAVEVPCRKAVKWFAKTKGSDDSPQATAIAHMKAQGDKVLMKRGNYEFGSFATQEAYIDYLMKTVPEKRVFYEVLEGACKMFCDIDGRFEDLQGEKLDDSAVFSVFYDVIQKAFQECGFGSFDPSKQRITSSSTAEKLSLHWHYVGKAFKTVAEQQQFWLYVNELIDKDYSQLQYMYKQCNGVYEARNVNDMAVYSKRRPMRSIYCRKEGSERVLMPRVWDAKTARLKPVEVPRSELRTWLVCSPEATEVYDVSKIKKLKYAKRMLKGDDVKEIIAEKVPNTRLTGVKGQMFVLKTVGTRMCLIGGEENTSDGCFVVWKRDGLYFGCHDIGCARQLKLIHKIETITQVVVDDSTKSVDYKLMADGDEGMAKAYTQLMKDDVKIIDGEGNGYMYDKKTALWLACEAIHIENSIASTLLPVFDEYQNHHLAQINQLIQDTQTVDDSDSDSASEDALDSDSEDGSDSDSESDSSDDTLDDDEAEIKREDAQAKAEFEEELKANSDKLAELRGNISTAEGKELQISLKKIDILNKQITKSRKARAKAEQQVVKQLKRIERDRRRQEKAREKARKARAKRLKAKQKAKEKARVKRQKAKQRALAKRKKDKQMRQEKTMKQKQKHSKKLQKLVEKAQEKLDKMKMRINSTLGQKAIKRKLISMLYDEEFDKKINTCDHLLPIPNKQVIDLKTSKVMPREKEHFFSIEIPIKYDPQASFDELLSVLIHPICCWNKDNPDTEKLVQDIQMIFGLFLSGHVSRSLYLFYGLGKNGKSIMKLIMSLILGQFYGIINTAVFIETGAREAGNAHTSHLMALKGIQSGWTDEIKPKDKLNVSSMKSFASGEPLAVRAAYARHQTELEIRAKGVLCLNDLPSFDGSDQAIVDRLVCVPFDARFVEEPSAKNEYKIDRDLKEKLQGGYLLKEFLAWAVAGAKRGYTNGFQCQSESVRMKTKDIALSEDPVQLWLDECCQEWNDEIAELARIDIEKNRRQGSFKESQEPSVWRETNNDIKDSLYMYLRTLGYDQSMLPHQQTISKTLKRKGFKQFKEKKERGFVGFRIRSVDESSDETVLPSLPTE